MAIVTLEQTHALLEKLAEYTMTQVSTRREFEELRQEVNELRQEMNERFVLVDKRFEHLEHRFVKIELEIEGVRTQISGIRSELDLFVKTFELHNKRLLLLEDDSTAYRVKDVEAAKLKKG